MRRLLALLFLLLSAPAHAQFTAPVFRPPLSSYNGPGDVVAGWAFWGGLRAFSGATAGTKAANICNSGDANCADVNTLANGNFDVTTAQGAPLNCGSTGGTCTIKTLYDKSGNARDLTEATAASRPTLVFGCTGLGAGLPCMSYSSSALLQSGLQTIAQPMTLVAAALQTSNASANRFTMIGDIGTDDVFFGTGAGAGCNAGGSISASTSLAFGSWGALQCVANGGTSNSSMTVNGSTTALSLGTGGISGSNLTSGTQIGTSTAGFVGSVAEIGIATTAFAAGTISSINSNMRTYWGF